MEVSLESKMEDPNTDMEDADSPASLLLQLRNSPVTASLGPAGPLLRQLHPPEEDPHLGAAMGCPVTASLGPARMALARIWRALARMRLHLGCYTGASSEGVSKDEIQNLTKDLEGLCISLLDHSEAKEPLSSTAKCWMSEVRELCYDTKNFFDLDDDAQLTPEEKQEISKLKFKALKDRASHAKDYQIDKPSNRKPKLASTRRRLPVLHPELIDRGRMDKLAALLRKDEEKQLKVVSVVGLEGVGKTTLAKRIYHQIKTGGQFECWGFVRVSPNPDMRRLLTTIFKQIQLPYSVSEGVSQPACCLDAQALITSIKDYLRDKRYFIIIDDLWSTSVWDVIRRAFPDGGCHSRIITTTQFKNVASACCSYQSKYIFEMQPLEDDQTRKLFSSMVFGSEDDDRIPEGIRKVTTEIIEKCRLPLSIINIASLLLTEESEINPKQWMDVRNSLPCTLRRNPTSEGIKEILNLIYNNLSPELKTCLLYLVVHPEGYTVNKGDLVKQWVIEGFIGEGKNKEEIAGWYFDELVRRGMIQAVDINCHGVLSCTLHHTVHNLIVNKSMEENFIISVDYFQSAMGLLDKVRRLSVQLAASRSARIPVGIMMSEVRSLAFFGFYGCVDFIEECKLLRVLILHVWADQDKVPFDLSGIICKLLPLRYVKIACNITVKLPAKIQDLQFLETLEVDTPVVSIPSDIGGLSRLSSLKIAVTELSREDIRILQKLRALTALSLHVCTTPVKMMVFDKEGFLVLKSFKFRCHLPWLKFEEGSMPDLRNLNLCFNAREADQHGIVPIGMEHLSCLEEITADIWGADADVGSTFRTAISNHPKNPRIYMQLVDPIVHGDATTSVGTIKVEDEKKQAASDSRLSTLLGSSSQVPVQDVGKKLRLEIETDGIEVKAETFGYDWEETAHRMSIQKIKTENIDDKPETKFVIPEGMDIEHCTPSSPMKTESIEDKLQTKFDILEDEKKPADIRMPHIERITHNVDRMDYNVFIRQLRNILAEHGDNPRQYVRDSYDNIHYVLPKQRPGREPERWIYIKLELDDGAETTLRVRDDNVDLIGFENKGGELFEFGFSGTMMIDGSKKKNRPLLRGSRFLECDVNYGSLVHGGAGKLVKMCLAPEPAVRSAVRRLSGYSQGDGGRVDEHTRRALAFLMVMVCEATRMRPLEMNTGWHAQCCCIDRKHIDYIWSWADMSEALLRWQRNPDNFEFPQCLRDIGVEHASHALDIVELLLNPPIHRPPQWRGERYQRPVACDDDARRLEQQHRAAGDRGRQRPAAREHGSGSRGKQQSLHPPPANKRRGTEQQHDQDQDQQPPPLPPDKGSGDSHLQETPPESPVDDYVARGRPLLEVFAVSAGFHFVGTISVFDGKRGQVIYENDNNGGAPPIHGSYSSSGHDDQPRPLLLTGPYRAISAYGSITIEVDISGARDVGELDWDCYDQRKVYDRQVTETITTNRSGPKVHVIYAVLSDAVDAELEVHLRLPGATAAAVYGRIATRSKAFHDEDKAWSVLFDSEDEGVPLVADSHGFITRLPLARSVVAMPLGSPLLITAILYDAPPSQHGVSPVFQFQDMELTLDMRRSSADNGGGQFEVSITSIA